MKEPLPNVILNVRKDARRRAVEDRIEQDIQFVPVFHKKEEYLLWPAVYSTLDKIATVYSKYRFRDISEAELRKRYKEIQVDNAVTEKFHYSKNNLIEEAEGIVDQIINEVCFGEKRTHFAGQDAYSRKAPFPESVLEDFQPHVLSRLARDSKDKTKEVLEQRWQQREDSDAGESRALLWSLKKYAARYIDYRLDRAQDGYSSRQDYMQTLARFEEFGLGEHVGNQFIAMVEKIADDTMGKHMGRGR